MIRGKAAVFRWVPVLRCDDEIEERLQPIRHRNNLVASRHRERAAGQEVILNINQDECIHGEKSQFEIEARLLEPPVSGLVETIEPRRTMRDVLLDFLRVREQLHAKN